MAWSEGERSVAATGSVIGSIIVTGDGNLILHHGGGEPLRFVLLDDDFRQAQRAHKPTIAFYDGVRANWAVIAAGMDAPRTLMGELLAFVEEAAQDGLSRIGLLLSSSGEGKSTLLRRTAWELAERGYAVLWHRRGSLPLPWEPGKGQSLRLPDDGRPLVLCFDDADQVEALPAVVESLRESDRHFVILGATRPNQWELAGMEGLLSPLPHRFELRCLSREEADALLERMEAHGGLGKLAELPTREARLRALLRTRERELQLLPALISARTGRDFDRIILNVLTRLRKREDGPFLLRAYLTLAAVHRFGYGLDRGVLAEVMQIDELDLRYRIIVPLKGLLAEVEEESDQFYTRHSVIAEHAMQLAERHGLVGIEALHRDLFIGFAAYLVERYYPKRQKSPDPFRYFLRSLVEVWSAAKVERVLEAARQRCPANAVLWLMSALFVKEIGNYERARFLFQEGTKIAPTHAPLWQAWALMEKEAGNVKEARRLFRKATEVDPRHAPSWQAWALMEKEEGNFEEARRLFLKGVEADPHHASLWQAWALMEKEVRDFEEARRLFRKGVEADPGDAPSWQAWALMELRQRRVEEALALCETALKHLHRRRDRAVILDLRAQALAALHRDEEAEATFREALALDEHDAHLRYHFVRFLMKQGRYEESMQHCEEALPHLRSSHRRAMLLDLLARALASLRRDEEAEATFREALTLDERSPHLHYHFARFLGRRGRQAEACEHYRAVLKRRRLPSWLRRQAEEALRRWC